MSCFLPPSSVPPGPILQVLGQAGVSGHPDPSMGMHQPGLLVHLQRQRQPLALPLLLLGWLLGSTKAFYPSLSSNPFQDKTEKGKKKDQKKKNPFASLEDGGRMGSGEGEGAWRGCGVRVGEGRLVGTGADSKKARKKNHSSHLTKRNQGAGFFGFSVRLLKSVNSLGA